MRPDYDDRYLEDEEMYPELPEKPRKKRDAKKSTARLYSDDGAQQVKRNHSRRYH